MTYSYAPNQDPEERLAYAARPEGDNIICSLHRCHRGQRAQTLDRTFLLISETGDEGTRTNNVQMFDVQTPYNAFLSMA
jgi:hypothetical protein